MNTLHCPYCRKHFVFVDVYSDHVKDCESKFEGEYEEPSYETARRLSLLDGEAYDE